ncbi:hypothetical protein M2G44_21890 [Vibrio vulnificus]|nr:hypothetical protein [Vibrio vulnificus]MCU8435187.1 hypothetical protein [Vibrio vulnificus]
MIFAVKVVCGNLV